VTSTRPVRVCHVITRLIVGGAQEAAIYASARVNQEEFTTLLVTGPQTGPEGDLRGLARDEHVPILEIPSLVREVSPLRDVRAVRSLRRAIRDWQPDVVQTHSSKAGVLGRLAARRERVPVIIHTVHGWSFHDHMSPLARTVYRGLERRAATWTDRIVTVSELDRAKGIAAGIGVAAQYRTIPPLNDLGRYTGGRDAREAGRAALGLPQDSFVVGTVGRLTKQKDPQTWVRTAALVASRAPEARFVMVGDGNLRAATERLAAGLGLGERLLLTGLRDDVPAILPAFDVLLLTSRWEGLPLVIPQAMASGVPVVATAVDGNREIVSDGADGLLAPPGEPVATADAVVRLRDPERAAGLATAGREAARDFSLERTVPRLEDLYRECVREKLPERSGPPGSP
jgi:glycosyltransferase involved in cell wall biosynthesis